MKFTPHTPYIKLSPAVFMSALLLGVVLGIVQFGLVQAQGGAVNRALNGTVQQSSTIEGATAGRANDDNTDGNYWNGSVTHTDSELNAWWEVDLGDVYSLDMIRLWNRTDCCTTRLSNFYIFVSDVPFSSTDLMTTRNQAGVSEYYHAGSFTGFKDFNIEQTGRYVRVQLAGTEYLSLAEVQIFDFSLPVSVSPPLGGVIANDEIISATFDVLLDNSTVNTSTFTVRGSQTGIYEGNYTFDPFTIYFDPDQDFKPGEEIVVTLNQGLQTADDGPVAPYTWQFRAAVSGGHGRFEDSEDPLGNVDSSAVALADLDGDDDLDIFVANYDQDSQVWFNDGEGGFSNSNQDLPWGRDIALGDLDNDGDLDIFVGKDDGANEVWLNYQNSGSFVFNHQSLSQAFETFTVALGDLDGDGDLDAFAGNEYEEPNEIWLNEGDGSFTHNGQSLGELVATFGVALGDLDGDGDLDAFLANEGDPLSVWLNNGLGNFSDSGQNVGTGGTALDVALGDVDDDGDLDVFIAYNSKADEIWLNDGSGNFSESDQAIVGTTLSLAVDLGDLDGDGDLDALVVEEDYIRVWLNEGGAFSDNGQALSTSFFTIDGALGDIDGDGDLDALVVGDGQANRILFNVPRQPDAVQSQLEVIGDNIAANDGLEAIDIRVTALDVNDNPIPEATVSLTSTASLSFTQPAPTDVNGETIGQVTSTAAGSFEVGAVINGIVLSDTVNLIFDQPELVLTGSGPSEAPLGESVSYQLTVQNDSLLATPNVVLTHTLPAEITFTDASITPTTQTGSQLNWQLGQLAGLESTSVVITGTVDSAAPIGSLLTATATVTSDLVEANLANNTDMFTTTVVAGPAIELVMSAPNEVGLLVPFDVTVTAYDAYGNIATGYEGTVQLTASSGSNGFPASHQFTAGDAGSYLFTNLSLNASGAQLITATDSLLSDSASLNVDDSLVIIDQDTTWNETQITLGTLLVTNTVRLTLQGSTTLTAVNLIIAPGSFLATDGQGYGNAGGPGAGAWAGFADGAGGGGYGGWGGNGSGTSSGGVPYGSVYQPIDLGSGGGTGNNQPGGAGGGAIHLLVSDTLIVSGTLSANGNNGVNNSFDASGGGSGGSLWLEANTFAGNGLVRANGGNGGWTSAYGKGGGGSGGRIAIYADTNNFSGTLQARGGGSYRYGGPGTIYLKDTTTDLDTLQVDNGGQNGRSAGLMAEAYAFDTIELTNSGHMVVNSTTSTITLTSVLTGDGSGRLTGNGIIVAPADFTVSNAILVVQGDLVGPEVINTVGSGGLELHANTPWHSGTYTFTEITIGAGTTLNVFSYNDGDGDYTDDYGLTLDVENLTIANGGLLTADAFGYGNASGPGVGGAAGFINGAGGGGYGGQGGDGNGGNNGGLAYGSVYQPIDLGSGGGSGNGQPGGSGGGAIHLVVSDTLIVSGTISANGNNGVNNSFDASGGGSGGSIWLEANTFRGDGLVRANGGNGGWTSAYAKGGGGGGGRIAIYAPTYVFSGAVQAQGGTGYVNGQNGSVYLDAVDPLASTVVAQPDTLVADGTEVTTVTVTLLTNQGFAVDDKTVSLQLVSGTDTFINGSPVSGGVLTPIGVSDDNGVVSATLTSTAAETKVLAAWADDVELSQTASITFTPGPVDIDNSLLTILGNNTAAADGVDTVNIRVTARDGFNNAIPGASVVFTSTSPINLPQVLTTNITGQVEAGVTSTQIGSAEIGALVNGILINDTVSVTFDGADLTVTKTGPAEIEAGQLLTYTLTVANDGLLPADDVVLTDTLPADIALVSHSDNFTPTQNNNTLTWELGDLAPGQGLTDDITVVGTIPLTVVGDITNQATVSSQSPELVTANNDGSVTTLVKSPAPILTVSPLYPTLVVSPQATNTLAISVTNAGSAIMTGATISPPPHLTDWVTIGQTDLGDILPGQTVTVTILAEPDGALDRGHYRDRLNIQAAGVEPVEVLLDVHVRGSQRDLQLTLLNNADAPVVEGDVILIEDILIVTEGITGSETFYRQGFTDEAGQLTFTELETDKAYDFDILAAKHVPKTGTITVTAGTSPQVWVEVLTGLPGLTVSPGTLAFSMARNSVSQQELVLSNSGAVTLTQISVLEPADLPWVYLGQAPTTNTVIAPNESLTVTINAAPTLSETADVYNSTIVVGAAGIGDINVPVQVTLHDALARNMCLDVRTSSGGLLTNGVVRLTDQTGQVVNTGAVTETLQNIYVEEVDSNGQACFENLNPGPYLVAVGQDDQLLGEKSIEIVPGAGDQNESIEVKNPSLIVDWSVTPTTIQDVYTTVITMTFVPEADPGLTISPRAISLCDGSSNGTVSETITIHNMYPVTFTNIALELETFGDVQATIQPQGYGNQPVMSSGATVLKLIGEVIGPNEDYELDLYAALNSTEAPACKSGDAGGLVLKVSADYEHFAPLGWYGFGAGGIGGGDNDDGDDGGNGTPGGGGLPGSGGGGIVPLGQPSTIPLKLVNRGYPAESNLHTTPPTLENVTLTPPQNLTWLTVSTTTVISIPIDSEVGFDLVVDPPLWLAQGTYYDHILVTATNSMTALIGIKADMTADGLRIETQFVTPLDLEDNPANPLTYGPNGRAAGLAYPLNYLPPGQGGTSSNSDQDYWASVYRSYNSSPTKRVDIFADAFTMRVVHCRCEGPQPKYLWGRVGGQIVFQQVDLLGGITPAPDFKDDVIILQVSQRYILEREAFDARLELTNALVTEITDLNVEIFFTDADGNTVPQRQPGESAGPTTPVSPVLPANSLVSASSLVSSMPDSWQESAPVNFVIIPETPTDLPNLAVSGSHLANWTIVPDAFGVQDPLGADFYVQAAISYEVNGVPQTLYTGKELITVHPQPKILLDYFIPRYLYENEPADWLVVATNVGYGPARSFTMEKPVPKIIKQSSTYPTNFTITGPSPTLNLGSGQQQGIAWQITASRSGEFVSLESACLHKNYQGVALPKLVYCEPTIHFVDNPPADEASQWGKEEACWITRFQGFDSDPVNTFSGNFTYNHMDVSIPTWGEPLKFERSYNSRDTEEGPLGPGWTHNYNMAILFESYLPSTGGGLGAPQNLLSVRLPRGSRAYFEVSDDGNTITPLPGVQAEMVRHLDTFTVTLQGDQTQYIFGADQRLASIVDANGNEITMTYSNEITPTERRLLYATGPAGRRLTFDYDEEGHLIKLTDPLSRTTIYTYTNGYLTATSDFRGKTTHFTYTPEANDLPGKLASIVDANGNVEVANQYNSEGRVIEQRNAANYLTTFSYDEDGSGNRITTITHPLGNVRIDTYNEDGLLIRQEDDHSFFEQYEYNADYNMTRLTDKNGHETQYEWHGCSVMAEVTDPLGNRVSTTVDDKNQVTSLTDERGFQTTITYDDRTNPLLITDPLSYTEEYTYGPRGEVLSRVNKRGFTVLYQYDQYGNNTIVTGTNGDDVYLNYDLAGRLLSTSDALGQQTTYQYDPGDNLLELADALSGTTTFSYDEVGNRLTMTDALGRETTYAYDTRDNLIQTINPSGDEYTFVYDANGNLSAETDENEHTTSYLYDGLNRLITTTNALSGTMSYTYDPVGNRLTEQDANGNIASYVYDAGDRQIETIFPDGSQIQATYDPADHLLTLTDGENRTIAYEYDALGRTTVMTNPEGGLTIYSYDAVGNETQVTDPAGRITQRNYDAFNRLVQVTDPLSNTTTYSYNAVGKLTSLTDAEGRITTYEYDALNRVTQVTNPLNDMVSYDYDAVGNLIQSSDELGRVTLYEYDELNHPVQITDPLDGIYTYGYDPLSNLLSSTDPQNRTATFAYDALNRQIAITDPLSSTTTFTYDANGNLLTATDAEERTINFSYDVFNQLISIEGPENSGGGFGYDHVGNLIQQTDANGQTVQYTYDGLDRLIQITDPFSNAILYNYDAVGNLLSEIDQEGKTTTYSYDALNRLITWRDALNFEATFSYDRVGNLLQTVDPEGRAMEYAYDDLNRLVQLTDALSQTVSYTYDAAGNQLSMTDEKGRTSSTTYDALNRPIAVTDPLNHTTIFTYSAVSNLTAVHNPLDQITRYEYDALDRLTGVTNALDQQTSYTYDRVGNQLSMTDPENRITTLDYDELNRLIETTDALNNQTHFAYDPVGNLLEVTNAKNQTILYNYDALNRLTTITDPLDQITQFVYDGVGNQIELIDPKQRSTHYQYDDVHRLVEIEDADNNLTTFTYDGVDNVLTLTDAKGRTTTSSYDALNRPLVVTNPLSGTTRYTYDEVGNQTSFEDAEGRVTTFTYDDDDRLIQTTDPLSQVMTYEYDALGNLLQIIDRQSRVTRYVYDQLNRQIQITNPLSGTTHFEYDAVSNLTRQIDPLGQMVDFTFDALDRLIEVQDTTGQSSYFTYDSIGILLSQTDRNGHTTTLNYDDLNRLLTISDSLNQTTRYEYDEIGNNTAIIDPLNHRTEFEYDNLDRLVTVTDPLNRITQYSYDAVGNQVGLVDAEGVVSRFTYDALDRLVQVTENFVDGASQTATINAQTQYSYDAVGNLTGITDPLGHETTFTYDPLDRLQSLQDPLSNEMTYSYDAVGNLAQTIDANGQTTSFNYDALDRLTTINRPDEIVQYSYDAVGNRLSMQDNTGTTDYTYDDLYRLTSVTDAFNQTVGYAYDAAGNRTQLTYPDGQQVNYAYDPADRLIEVEDWDSLLTQYTYDAASRLTGMTAPNGVESSYTYDAANQLTLLQHQTLTQTLSTYAYTYDNVGNRIQAVETVMRPSLIPTASFTATPLIGVAPLSVTFHQDSINATSLLWDFGDGLTETAVSSSTLDLPPSVLTHTYTQPGYYTVTLSAASDAGAHILSRTNYIVVIRPDAFQEKNGQLVIEAEHFHTQTPGITAQAWITRSVFAGYEGDSYIQTQPDQGTRYDGPDLSDSPALEYEVNFVMTGTYAIWLRGAAVDATGDSVYLGLDNQLIGVSGFAPGIWEWENGRLEGWADGSPVAGAIDDPTILTITEPGPRTLTLWMREDGFRLDRILLTTDTLTFPSGSGPAESPSAGESSIALAAPAFTEETRLVQSPTPPATFADSTLASAPTTPAAPISPFATDPVLLLLSPLSFGAILARRRKWRRWAWIVVVLLLALGLLGTGTVFATGTVATSPGFDLTTQVSSRNTYLTPDLRSSQAVTQSAIINYTYDDLYRLTQATYDTGESYAFTYDAAGNRLTYAVNGSQVATYTYDIANRLTQLESDTGSQVYSYDNNGNLLDDGTYSYTYDSANRLTQLADEISTVDYVYNGDGVRVAQIVDGLRTDYVQDVAAPLPQLLTARQGGTVSNYLRGLGLIGEQQGGGGPFASPAVWQYHLSDALGSVRQVTDPGRQVTLTQSYDPFGGLRSVIGLADTAYGFTGEEQDEQGHVFLRARTYNPATGRFLQRDSVPGLPDQPRTLHRYPYGFNNPINYTDPSGNMPDMPAGRGNRPQANRLFPESPLPPNYVGPYNENVEPPDRSANNNDWRNKLKRWKEDVFGDEHRPRTCREIVEGVMDKVNSVLDHPLTSVLIHTNPLLLGTKLLYEEILDRTGLETHQVEDFITDALTFGLENPDMLIALTPLDVPYDIASLITGRDLLTGRKLSKTEKAAIAAGLLLDLVTGGIGGDLLQLGARNSDEILELGAKHSDKLIKYGDDVVEFGDDFAKYGDDLADLGDDFAKIGDDLAEFGDDFGKFGDDLAEFGDDFAKVRDDFADELGKVGSKQVDDLAEAGTKQSDDVAQAGTKQADDVAGSGAKQSDDVADAPSKSSSDVCPIGRNSFTAGTLVETEDGLVPIEEIEVGDDVLSEDPETGEQGYFEVVALTNHPTDIVFEISITSNDTPEQPDDDQFQRDTRTTDEEGYSSIDSASTVMTVTPEHPIYVEGKGWSWAENLALGDRLRRADGGWAKVLAIDHHVLDTPVEVYNFTVKGPHTYFVHEVGILVHNCPPDEEPDLDQLKQHELSGFDDVEVNPFPKEKLRGLTPSTKIQDYVNVELKGGCIYCGAEVDVYEAEHIVPFDHIRKLEGFDELKRLDDIKSVLNYKPNFRRVCSTCNKSRQSSLYQHWSGPPGAKGPTPFTKNKRKLIDLYDKLKQELIDLIEIRKGIK